MIGCKYDRTKARFGYAYRTKKIFLGLCKNVKVVINSFEIHYSSFVRKTRDHDLVFRKSFVYKVQLRKNYKLDKGFESITYLQSLQSAILQTPSP